MLKFTQVISVVVMVFCVNGAALAYQDHKHQHHGHAEESADIQFTAAEVVEVDTEHNEVVLRHETIEHLNMSAMTMAFTLAEHIDISSLQQGDHIKVKVERDDNNFVITEVEAVSHHH
ncbi:copper-binding protein [Aliidiomarina sp. Khilg15.8]